MENGGVKVGHKPTFTPKPHFLWERTSKNRANAIALAHNQVKLIENPFIYNPRPATNDHPV
jgi:hypothetical protein